MVWAPFLSSGRSRVFLPEVSVPEASVLVPSIATTTPLALPPAARTAVAIFARLVVVTGR